MTKNHRPKNLKQLLGNFRSRMIMNFSPSRQKVVQHITGRRHCGYWETSFCPTCLHPSPSWHGPQDVNDVDSMPGDNHRSYPTSKCGQGTTQRLGPRRPRACKKCNFHSSFVFTALLTKPSSRLPNNRKRCRFNSWPFFFSGQAGG